MQNIKNILERIWTRVPPSKLSGNILDAMKAYFLGHNFGFSVTLLLSVSHMLPPLVHQPLERSREGAVRAAQERMGNKCLWRSARRWCLPGHTSWTWSPTSSAAALVRYGAHPTASPRGHSGDGQSAVHGHRRSWSLSQGLHGLPEIQQMCFQLVLRFKA